jgi:GR25 family glycosyltransferase involved in LPS biosynthesis
LYINLKQRKDRRLAIEEELKLADIRAIRVEGVEVDKADPLLVGCWNVSDKILLKRCAGRIGCKLSHVKALKYAEEKGWPHVAIFEDDFQWNDDVEASMVLKSVKRIQEWKPDWDVIALSVNVLERRIFPEKQFSVGAHRNPSYLMQIHKSTATHGYLVHARMIPVMLQIYLSCDVRDGYSAIDICLWPFQHLSKWYGLTPQIAKQGTSYSDIEGKEVSYTIRS